MILTDEPFELYEASRNITFDVLQEQMNKSDRDRVQ
ncbi:hypothetical protein DET53_101355 [Vibrio parahaemolyticus]|jgi:hypothetical protein|nr:hypothetical protein DET53_101355 [Vibrio parahaemolyticus]